MNKQIFFIFSFILLISMVSAYDLHQQNVTYSYSETVANADSCNLTSITYPDGTISSLNILMDKSGFDFTANISNNNFTQLGPTCWGIVCYDADAIPEYTSDRKCLIVTPSGELPEMSQAIVNLVIVTFLILLVFLLYYSNSHINYDKWRNDIVKKYENRNYVKLTLSAILHNVMKNTFVLYYLLGFPVILLITDMVYVFGINSMIDIMGIFLFLYTIGSIFVGLFLFSNVQEWIMDLLEEFKNINWGVE